MPKAGFGRAAPILKNRKAPRGTGQKLGKRQPAGANARVKALSEDPHPYDAERFDGYCTSNVPVTPLAESGATQTS